MWLRIHVLKPMTVRLTSVSKRSPFFLLTYNPVDTITAMLCLLQVSSVISISLCNPLTPTTNSSKEMRVLGPVYKNNNLWYSHFVLTNCCWFSFYDSMNAYIIFNSICIALNFECLNSRYLPVVVMLGDSTSISIGCEVFKNNFTSF